MRHWSAVFSASTGRSSTGVSSACVLSQISGASDSSGSRSLEVSGVVNLVENLRVDIIIFFAKASKGIINTESKRTSQPNETQRASCRHPRQEATDCIPGGKLTGGIAGTRTSGGGGGEELEDTHGAGNRWLLEPVPW